MLNEVKRLCKNDFSGINKEFKVFQGDEFSQPFVVKTFKTKKYKTKHQTCGGFKWKFRD